MFGKDHDGSRRGFIATLAYSVGALGLGVVALGGKDGARAASEGTFPLKLTSAEWKKKLTSAQFYILREEGTERAFTSPLNDQHGRGIFACVGCDRKLYSSETKFDSGTGWPSFWQPLKDAVGESRDSTLGFTRTEVHCANCGGHIGHVFDDGPKPTGLRYCMNGVAMKFEPGASA